MTPIFSVTKTDTFYFKGWMAAIRVMKLDCSSKKIKIDVPKK